MTHKNTLEPVVQHHYARPNLADAILTGLASMGKDLDHLKPEDLAPVDEFHVRGREATIELARQLTLIPGIKVLDVGSGIGGASRYLASQFGCQVTGLDLSEEYCAVAQMLAQRAGLDGRVSYRQGSALEMPFENDSFDLVWTQHATMNISEKPRLYNEIGRVLRPGGAFAMYDVLAGPGGPILYPVPWAREPSISFLIDAGGLKERLNAAGLHVTSWRDTTSLGMEWFRFMAARGERPDSNRAVGMHVLMGPEFRIMSQTMVQNLEEKRAVLVECIAQK